MEACTTAAQEIIQTPAEVTQATPAVHWTDTTLVKGSAMALAFSIAFSGSFVLGFYWLGPYIDSVRSAL